MRAVRNITLCTKDCLCLYVCPTGATDTETGQIDALRCNGCEICAKACPSGAISMVPKEYPPQQKKSNAVVNELFELASSKTVQEKAALQIASATDKPIKKQLAMAIAKSNRIMAEDLIREAGYMIPQSANVNKLLRSLLEAPPAGFPIEVVERLLELIKPNEKVEQPKKKINLAEGEVERWQCSICGHIHEGPMTDDFTCPLCNQPPELFERIWEV
ncbi:MAG TPA: 4Fe-4S binding protein [Epulopiscium sp.]|nr:4Fe-4S binding protein [Candidatus Epulonipiscium sp.]